jgi:hypothetical protein
LQERFVARRFVPVIVNAIILPSAGKRLPAGCVSERQI